MKHYEQEEKSDNIVNEELMYEALVGSEEIVLDGDFDIDDFYERNKEAIEAANKRIHNLYRHQFFPNFPNGIKNFFQSTCAWLLFPTDILRH